MNPAESDPSPNQTTIMVYTQSSLARGTIQTLPAIRVTTWLRTQAAPEFLRLMKANVVTTGVGGMQNLSFDELVIPVSQVIAYHIQPPASDPVDYDPSEPNRKLEPVTLMIGNFRFNGHLRMATQSFLFKYLETSREVWTSLYDVDINNTGLPSMGTLHVNIVLIRATGTFLAPRVAPPPAG